MATKLIGGWLKESLEWSGGKRHRWVMPVGPYVAHVELSKWGWDYTITGGGGRPLRVGSWQEKADAVHACEARLEQLLQLKVAS